MLEGLVDEGRIKMKERYVATVGVNFGNLIEDGIISSEYNYISTCDLLEKEVDKGLKESSIGEFHYPEVSGRNGETLSIRFVHHWDLRNGMPKYNIPSYWELLEFELFVTIDG